MKGEGEPKPVIEDKPAYENSENFLFNSKIVPPKIGRASCRERVF